MIMRERNKTQINRRVPRSELINWMRDANYILKDSQVPYHDLRKTKDRFEWNDFKRNTITFEQICQIKNKNSILSKYKCNNKDKRVSVPKYDFRFGIQSSMVTAVVKKYISNNRNSEVLSEKYKKLTQEITDKEFRQYRDKIQKMKKKQHSVINYDLIDDQDHDFVENTSYFANPNFSTLKSSVMKRKT